MCGRFKLVASLSDILGTFGAATRLNGGDWQGGFEQMTPGVDCPVLIHGQVGLARWGFVPHWAADDKMGPKLKNARSETAHEKPSFRDSWEHRRCLVPANGFYEWPEGDTAKGQKKPCYFIHDPDYPLFVFAGLWSKWQNPETGTDLVSFTILTKPADGDIASIHSRMPVILRMPDALQWYRADAGVRQALIGGCNAKSLIADPYHAVTDAPKQASLL